MLVLTRKKNTSIRIGDQIVIHVIRTGGGSVRLGIEAPGHLRVVRGELALRLDAPQEEANHSDLVSPTAAAEDEAESMHAVAPAVLPLTLGHTPGVMARGPQVTGVAHRS